VLVVGFLLAFASRMAGISISDKMINTRRMRGHTDDTSLPPRADFKTKIKEPIKKMNEPVD
jgi:hypothetical protein